MNVSTINTILKNEDGLSIISLTLMVMAILSVIIVIGVNETTTEMRIARNDVMYKMNLFEAEGAVREAAQVLEDMVNPQAQLNPTTTTLTWVNNQTAFDPSTADWEYTGAAQNAQTSDMPGGNAGYTVTFNGIVSGSGLDMTDTTSLYEYTVYGRSEANDGDCIIMVGYRLRY